MGTKHELRDSASRLLGYTRQEGNKIVLYNDASRMLGYYRISEDRTYNDASTYIGRGNLLMTLLRPR